MEIRNSKSIRINFLSLFLIGSGSIALLLFSISLLLTNIYGRFEIGEIYSAVKQMDLLPKDSEYSAAILFSDYSDKLLNEDNNWNENNIRTWQKFVESSDLKLEIIDDESIESGEFLKYQLLILPSSKALSNKQIIQIKQYLENGGNIFATNSTATFTEEGKWRGWKFFNEVFGIKFISEFTGNGLIQKQSFRGGIPLTAGIPSGFSLRVASWDSPMACQIMEPRVNQIGFWNDFRTNNNFISTPIENMTSVVSGTYGKGRFVWMGFDINSVYGEQEEYIMFEKFFNNIMNWLTEKPIIFVKDWPSDYKSAVIVNVINNSEMSSLQNIINYIDKYALPVTFFVNPELASQDVLKLKMLSQYGKIGALVALGNLTSADKITYQLDNYKGQLDRLTKAKKLLDPIIDTKINSALPLFGRYDENTVHALIGSNYKIAISDSLFNRSVPSSIIKGKNQIISINKTAYSDLEIDANFGQDNLDFQLSTYKEDVDRIILEGGLYNLNLHSSIFSNSSYNALFDELFSYFTNKNMWITSAEELKDWWIAKSSIEVGIKSISDRRISFLITNRSDLIINNLIVQIDINKNIENLEIKSEIIGTELPSYVYIREKGQVLLKLQGLQAGKSNSYFIDFDNTIL